MDAPPNDEAHANTNISIEEGVYVETPANAPRARTKLETAQISLNDCLACSGCVTSAETVLIGLQSIDEVQTELERKGERVFVMTISTQTLASLEAAFGLPLSDLFPRIEGALTQMGFDVVQDTTLARHMALRAHVREFCARRDARQRGDKKAPTLPMLASACPGWVCYAEKAHSELLPYVATTKSPQQMAGLLAKRIWGPEKLGIGTTTGCITTNHSNVYHVAVMPCYDKKLEASRAAMTDAAGVKDVDCVLTTGELHDLLVRHAFQPDQAVATRQSMPEPEPGSSSGGYLFAILLQVYQEWRTAHPTDETPTIDVRTIRSSDYTEYVMRAPDGTTLFKGATCYGFRNLQNLVRKLQRETGAKGQRGRGMAIRRAAAQEPAYDYIEVMACPSGCVNGGGQMRPPEAWIEMQQQAQDANVAHNEEEKAWPAPPPGWQGTDRRWVHVIEQTYWGTTERVSSTPTQTQKLLAQAIDGPLQGWLQTWDAHAASMETHIPMADVHTSYQGVEAPTNGLAVQW